MLLSTLGLVAWGADPGAIVCSATSDEIWPIFDPAGWEPTPPNAGDPGWFRVIEFPETEGIPYRVRAFAHVTLCGDRVQGSTVSFLYLRSTVADPTILQGLPMANVTADPFRDALLSVYGMEHSLAQAGWVPGPPRNSETSETTTSGRAVHRQRQWVSPIPTRLPEWQRCVDSPRRATA